MENEEANIITQFLIGNLLRSGFGFLISEYTVSEKYEETSDVDDLKRLLFFLIDYFERNSFRVYTEAITKINNSLNDGEKINSFSIVANNKEYNIATLAENNKKTSDMLNEIYSQLYNQ